MRKKILITGGSGLIGSALTKMLKYQGHEVRWLTRRIKSELDQEQFEWDVAKGTIDSRSTLDVDVIIHLAGASVGAKRWNEAYKKEMWDSRVASTDLLFQACKQNNQFPRLFVSGSAIGYFGYDRGEEILTESSKVGIGYMADLTKAWEESAVPFKENGSKVSWLRTGIVFSAYEGALERISAPIKWGVGASLASGKQYMSWIHEDDQINAICYIVENELSGPFNLVSPNPATNKEVTRAIAKQLKKPLILPPVPGFILKLLVGEFAQSVIGGLRISPDALVNSGFEFEYPNLESALKEIFKI